MHPKLEPILRETYGILVYQEQLMQVAGELFGYNLGEADLMRRAVSKKKEKDLMLHKAIFRERGPENGIDEETAEKIFAEIEFFANYGFNKCLTNNTEIIDANSGRVVTIGDLVTGRATVFNTLSTNLETMQIESHAITDVISNGVKPVYTLTTRTGRQITATANHPFYTFNGWKMLGELGTGDLIAAPRLIPIEGKNTWPDYQLITLGHLLAEGNLCHTTGGYFYTARDDQRDDYVIHMEQFSNSVASVARHKSCHSIYSKRIQRSKPQGVVEWIKELGLWGKGASEKFIPSDVFTLTNHCIGLLLARMWEDDGHVNPRYASLHYTTVSKKLVYQMQHLLLRFGIVGRIYHKVYSYQNGDREGWEFHVMSREMITLFAQHIGCHFAHTSKIETLANMMANLPVVDAVPFAVRERVDFYSQQRGWTKQGMLKRAGVGETVLNNSSNRVRNGITRRTLSKIAGALESLELKQYAESDIYWDQIVSIVPAGEAETFDLTIEGTHNFIANDLLVHNSHAADYAVLTMQTAFLKAHYPEEYMTALLCVQFDNSDKVATFLDECRRLQIPILQPDVNGSQFDFDIQVLEGGKRAIRFGLGAIKHVGGGVVELIINARAEHGEFTSLEHFAQVIELKDIGKRPMESLIKVGAFDSFGHPRDAMLESLDRIMGYSLQFHKEKNTRARSLFGDDAALQLDIPPAKKPVKNREQFAWERELMGLYVSGNPLDQHREKFAGMNLTPIQELKDSGSDGQMARVGGEVMSVRKMPTKSGEMMAVFIMADWHPSAGSIEVVLFPRNYKKAVEALGALEPPRELNEGEIFAVGGTLDTKRGSPQIIAEGLILGGDVAKGRDVGRPPEHETTPVSSYTDESPIYDEETGEMISQDRLVYAPPAATTSNGNGNGNGHHNGNGNGNGHRSAASDADVFANLFEAADYRPTRHIRVYFQRNGNLEADEFRLRRLYGEIISQTGDDTFSIITENGPDDPKLWEFQLTTRYDRDLLNRVAALVGENNIVVR